MSDDHVLADPGPGPTKPPGPSRQPPPEVAYDTAAGYGSDGASPAPEALDPWYLLRVLHKWRWSAVTVFILIVAGTAVYTFTAVPLFEARVRVLVEPDRLNILSIQDIVEQDRSIEAQIAVLQSRWLAKETMLALNLLRESDPPFAVAPPQRTTREHLLALWSSLVGQPADPPAASTLDPARAENAQIDAFLGGLAVTTGAKGVLDIRYRSADPAFAARVANAVARQYIDQNLEIRYAAIEGVSDWLTSRIGEQRQRLDAAEQALQAFRERNLIVVADGADNPTIAKLNDLSASATRARTSRLEKEAALNRLRALRGDAAAIQRQPQMLADPFVQQLRVEVERLQRERGQMAEKLQDRHPDMIRMQAAIQTSQAKLQAEMDRVFVAAREEVELAQTTEDSLAEALAVQQQAAIGLNRKGVELGVLEREVQSNRQIYDMLMQRARETNIAKDLRPSQIRILDAADVPRAPFAPRPRQNMMMALLAGLVAAFGVAFGFDQLDTRIKTPDEIKSRLALPFLGLVPEIETATGRSPLTTDHAPPNFIESMRSIRTNVLYSFADESMKAVVVTSATIGEGKTVVASNLAIALAQAGERVLLIDADMRRPTLHRLFSIERQRGLSNLLVGNVKASDVVRRSKEPNLWLLPSGHPPPNPPELLGSKRFEDMLSAFGQHFDWVLLDAPPVMAVTDACVLARKSSGVLFVVGAERVSRQVARRALEQLTAIDARLIGAVLTRVDLKRNAYYYSKYYHPRYDEYAAPASM